MKPSTNKVESKKKKKKEDSVEADSAKKSRVHAQRKFAQGSGPAAYVNALTRERDKKQQNRSVPVPKAPLLTHRVPSASQFLDFLCFGRTNLLPPDLHYLRDATVATASSGSAKHQSNTPKEEKKPILNVEEALRKKYQNQRLANQKATSVTKMAMKVKGKVMVRTRSAVNKEETIKPEKSETGPKVQKKKVLAIRRGLQREKRNVSNVLRNNLKLQRAGLRSGGRSLEPKNVAKETAQKAGKTEQALPKEVKVKGKTSRRGRAGEPSSDDEPLMIMQPRSKSMRTRSSINIETDNDERKKQSKPLRKKVVSSAESSPERPLVKKTKIENQSSTEKRAVIKRPILKKTGDIIRRATRSMKPALERDVRNKKETIRELIQKKKQNSLKLLTRLRSEKAKEGNKVEKDAEDVGEAKDGKDAPKSRGKLENLSAEKAKNEKPFIDKPKPEKQVKPSSTKEILKSEKVIEKPAEGKSGKVSKTEKAVEKAKPSNAAADVGKNSNQVEKRDKKPEKTENETSKTKQESKTKVKKEEKEVAPTRQPSKRPVRKCSTVDRMWIDVDGFTSDEEDFIDMESIIAATKVDIPQETKTSEKIELKKGNGRDIKHEDVCEKERVSKEVKSQPTGPKNEVKREMDSSLKKMESKEPACGSAKAAGSLSSQPAASSSDVAKPPEPKGLTPVSPPQPVKTVQKEEEKKMTPPKTLSFTSIVDPNLFPKTAAWLKSHELKDAQRNEQKRAEAGLVSPPSTSTALPVENSHSLIARLANNNAAMAKPHLKIEAKPAVQEARPVGSLLKSKVETSLPVKPVELKTSPLATISRSLDQSTPKSSPKQPLVDAVKKSHDEKKDYLDRMSSPNDANSKPVKIPLNSSLSDELSRKKREANREKRRQFLESEAERRRHLPESSEESDTSSEKVAKKKRTRRPSPRAEVVTRKERPKRQCSTMGKSWIERDSDESSFYDDEQVMELIRLSEKEVERSEKARSKARGSDAFSESDDEPLMKKTHFTPSPSSFLTPPRGVFSSAATSPITSVPPPTLTFRTLPREPINTHGLDLLSEVVAVADKSTDRIEQWLKESIRADGEKGFIGFEDTDIRRPQYPVSNSNIPDPVLHFVRKPSTPPKPATVTHEVDASPRKVVPKEEPVLKRPPVSSVTDLIKLQRERKGSPKPMPEHHSKNCKCNSCVVKKAWFKNKVVPEEPKCVTKEVGTDKPVEKSQETPVKASVSVAPMVQVSDAATSKVPTSPRKLSFLERMRERERREALVKPHTQPFSPSNEASVYAFEPEPLKGKKSATTTTAQRAVETAASTTESQSHQSTSIAVQVNFDESIQSEPVVQDDGKSIEISTQTEVADEDADSQMFYIPLQHSGVAASQPMIQGVTVKLGTEGPVGPNQKVVMQAKLVTKPPTPSMKAVVMPQPKAKEKSKMTPPVGTVQPTTRRPPASPRPRASVSPSSSKSSQSCSKAGLRGASPQASPKARPVKDVPKVAAATGLAKPNALMVEAPTFHLTEKDFQDPLEFFDRIRPAAERFGICRIVPPSSFKPDCKVADDMRFTAYNQFVHRMFHRWGPSVRETMAMKKYLKTQSISLKPPPCVGGIEIDLPRLYQAVQTCGGLMKVMEKEKWQQVADLLRLPKAAHDRTTKLDSIYCQYLLPYDTLKPEERTKLLSEVDADWAAHEETLGTEAESEEEEENYIEECEECIVKGKSMALNQFYRIARNTMSMWFKSAEPDPGEVEAEFWRLINERKQHVCVHSGSIDSSGWGYGFPVGKNTFAKHPWNLKVLTNNSGSVLRSLGPVMGVTVPTLHVGMVFAAFCWYRDPHGLPWVEYLHTGAPKIWYGISDSNSTVFREALTKLMPKQIKDQRIWLPCDTAMVPPERLTELGVPLSRTTQHPGQFVVVFPRAFTSSLCTGYLVSESVYFARPSWLQTAEDAFRDIHDSSEPSVFSLDNLLISIAGDSRTSLELLKLVLPMVTRLLELEQSVRQELKDLGVPEEPMPREKGRRRGRQEPEPDQECEVCRKTLFLSMVSCAAEEAVYCLQHGLRQLSEHKDQVKGAKLLYGHSQDDIKELLEKLDERIKTKQLKAKK